MASQKTTLLKLDSITKTFGHTHAVSQASFSVDAGEVVGFLGPNGAGKSTTIRMIMQEIYPTSGSLELFGIGNSPAAHRHEAIGYLASDMTYEEGLTGEQYLSFVNHLRGGGHEDRIESLCHKLDANLHHRIRTLSRGNKQKIGLIAAVMHQPKLLIMDEPTSGFDPLMQNVFLDLIREHTSAGGGALISSHILSEIQHSADRVVFIADGKILGEQNIHTLLRESPLQIHLRFTSDSLAKTAYTKLTKIADLKLDDQSGDSLRATYRGEVQVLLKALATLKPDQCLIQEPELEEIFMQYYNKPTEKAAV